MPFTASPLQAAFEIVSGFDPAKLKLGDFIAFIAYKNKSASKQWVVGKVSALNVSDVHWARVKEWGNKEYAAVLVQDACTKYGSEWHRVAARPEADGSEPCA